MCKQRGETRKQRREQQRQEKAKARAAREFVEKMNRAKEAKQAQRLFLEHGAKLVSLPDDKAKSYVERWKTQQIMRLMKKANGTRH